MWRVRVFTLCLCCIGGACVLPHVSHGVSRALCAPSSSRLAAHLLCLSVSSACLPSPPLPSALSPCLSHILPPSACLPVAVLLVCPSPRLHFIGAMVVIESRKERRSAAKLARFGHVPRHQCCCPPRSAEAADRQHTPLSAAVPAVSPRLCFLGTVAVDRGRRVIAQNGCLMANNVAGGIAHVLTPLWLW